MQEGKTLFARIDDSPMFRQQIQSLEENSDTLRDKCLKYYKGCRKYTGANPRIADLEGKTPCHLVSELALNDVEILALLKVANR